MNYEPMNIAGETLWLLSERAIYWPAKQALLIADLHLGKAASFRAAGIPLPHGTTKESLARLTKCVIHYPTEHIIFLGDFWHSASGRADTTLEAMDAWRNRHPSLRLTLIRGNHDHHAGDPPAHWRIDCVPEPYVMQPFSLCHFPEPNAFGYVLAGHIHPAIRLSGQRKERLTLRCFCFSKTVGVLPAFGEFTGSHVIQPREDDSIFVIGDDTVIPLAKESQ